MAYREIWREMIINASPSVLYQAALKGDYGKRNKTGKDLFVKHSIKNILIPLFDRSHCTLTGKHTLSVYE
jgi:hypothetical protein